MVIANTCLGDTAKGHMNKLSCAVEGDKRDNCLTKQDSTETKAPVSGTQQLLPRQA